MEICNAVFHKIQFCVTELIFQRLIVSGAESTSIFNSNFCFSLTTKDIFLLVQQIIKINVIIVNINFFF